MFVKTNSPFTKVSVLLLGICSLLIVACGSSGADATPTPTKTVVAQSASEAPTAAAAISGGADSPESDAQNASEQAAEPTVAPEPQATPTSVAESAQSSAVSSESSTPSTATISADSLNIRNNPTADATVLRLALSGEAFDVDALSSDGEWALLSQNGTVVGWAAAEFLALSGVPEPVAAAEPTATTATAAAGPTAAPVEEEATEAPAPTAASASQAVPASFLSATMQSPAFGAQAFLWWREETADRDLKLMKDAGFDWVKHSFAWETIEGRGPGQYDWSIADRVVRQAHENQLRLLARLSTDPELTDFWAGHPPGNADSFASFAGALAKRYNCSAGSVGCIQAYQIWNEPNLAREWGETPPNPAEYAAFLKKTYAAIKAGNPNAIVISAGMAPTGTDNEIAMPDDKFYRQMYAAMGGNSSGYFDMLGVHGSGFAAPPELDPASAAADPKYGGYRFFSFRHVEDIRQIMVENGDSNKKIVLLEFGWTYDSVNESYKWHGADAGIDALLQAQYLTRAYQYAAANWSSWIGLMSLLTMPNTDWLNDGNPKDEEQYWWAIMDPSLEGPKFRPAYIFLCDYFNEVRNNLYCPYDPDTTRRGPRS